MDEPTRTPMQIAREVLKEAQADGIVRDFALRVGGRATVYPAFGGYGKFYTTSSLDTLTLLSRLRKEFEGSQEERCAFCGEKDVIFHDGLRCVMCAEADEAKETL